MAKTAIDCNAWKKQIQKHLGRRCVKHTTKLACDILLVDVGLKRSFLVDYGCTNPEVLSNFVNDILQEGLVRNKLFVTQVEDDVFICNAKVVWCKSNETVLVDVSGHLENPVLIESKGAQKILTILEAQLEQNFSELTESAGDSFLDMHLADSVNRSTAFGYLLNYPVLYWYQTSTWEENCLSMVPLRNANVTVECEADDSNRNEHVAWSFSYPESFLSTVSPRVKSWYNDICKNFTMQSIFKSVNIHEETVSLPCVAL